MIISQTGVNSSVIPGDDGDLELGAVWPVPRFTDNDDGTITDNLTGIIWLKDAGCLGNHNWLVGFDKISDLNSGTDFNCQNYTPGIFDDWRMPNINELLTLVHYGSLTNPPNRVSPSLQLEGVIA